MQRAHLNVESSWDPPTPRYFVKRVCKLLKTKEGSAKKSAKRFQEAANCSKDGTYRRDTEGTEAAKAWMGNAGRVTPRGFCMDVKTRGLLEKGFVRLWKQKSSGEWPLEDRGKRVVRGSLTRHPRGDGK
jgi:hypothetical protein